MNKFLMAIRILLLISLFVLNYCTWKITELTSYGHILYLLFTLVYAFQMIKDIKKKNKINQNKMFQLLSILAFSIMIIISLRVVADKSFIYNNIELQEEYLYYCDSMYGPLTGGAHYDLGWDILRNYMKQNMIYFNTMFVLLFLYRRINMDKKKSKFFESEFWKYKGIA